MAGNGRNRLLVVGARGIDGHEGGIEKFAEEFVKRAKHSANISVMVLGPNPSQVEGVKLLPTQNLKLLNTDKVAYLLSAVRHIASGRYDTLFILGINFAMLAPLARIMRMRVVLRSGSIDHQLTKWNWLMRSIFRVSELLGRFAHATVAVAPSIAGHLNHLGFNPVLIRNGLEKVRALEIKERKGILAVGRLTAQKNFGFLIDALHSLGSNRPVLEIIGGADASPESSGLEKKVEQLKMHDSVLFAGARDRSYVLERLSSSAIYVNCSHHEGMSNAILEAIQQGTPILLSDIPANRDLNMPEQFYFSLGEPQQLGKKIMEALKDPAGFTVDLNSFDDWDTVTAKFSDLLQIQSPRST
jgi:glycosyltransferase involved in cell wall biosynthesis